MEKSISLRGNIAALFSKRRSYGMREPALAFFMGEASLA
jgi:hypothetical protein